MITDFARPIPGLARNRAGRLAVVVSLLLPAVAFAQHNKESDAEPDARSNTKALSAEKLDWVPIDQLPEDQHSIRCQQCEGRYVDPLAGADQGIAPEESDIEALTNATEMRGDTVILTGGVEAVQGYRHLKADTAVVDREKRSALLTGNVTLREPGLLLRGEQAELFSETGEATVQGSHFLLHEDHLRGSADMLERDGEGVIHVHDGSFTYCAPGDKTWAIKAENLELNLDEGVATVRNAQLRVADVPVFWTPWASFPIDDRRKTGLLWPDWGNDSNGGLDISVPVYINLAPNYDALYAPRYIEERGTNHEVILRYLNPYIGLWSIGGAYMANDKRYEDQLPDQRSSDRWLAVVKQNGLFNERWRSRIDYGKASDVDYMKDLETANLENQRRTSLLQLASLDYLGDDWLINLDMQQFQSLADDIGDDYKKLPQLTGQYRGRGTPFELEPIFVAQYSNFDTDENRVTGQRLYAEAGVTYPMLWQYGFVTPKIKYRQLNYDLSDGTFFTDDKPSAGSALASVDGGLVFERSTSFANKNLVQTLEPRLYYLYSGYDEQTDQPDFDSAELTFNYNQLFRETRFSGRDRLDDANQLSLGVTTRYIDSETGQRLLSASIGQIFYFRDRKVRLLPTDESLDQSGSEIAGEVSFSPNKRLDLRTNLVWDPYSGNMNAGYFLTSYKRDNGSVFNVGYSYRRPLSTLNLRQVTEEAHFSAYMPLNKNWAFFAALDYSLQANISVQDMIGLEYDACCWKMRLLNLRYYDNVTGQVPDFSNPNLERENSFQVQFILKGMGGFGNRITNIMEDMIRGFEESDY
tara:strand:+ start:47316 stop:49745 length:2430 start_codon:yes stop_codon:yes gene_type:complete